jgi:hypothetical protein
MAASSSSSDLRVAGERAALAELIWKLANDGERLPDDAVNDIMAAATKLYSNQVAMRRTEIALANSAINPTDLVVLACALLRAGDLNPFDLAIWFGQVATE